MNCENNSQILDDDGDANSKCDRIRAIIDSFLQNNPRQSLQSIENKTGLPISTLRRMISINGNPNPENVVKLYLALGFDQELAGYMEKFHPEIASIMALKSHNLERSYVEETEAQYFTEESSFLIMTMAYTSFGITEDEIKNELGLKGLSKLNQLITKGLIVRRHDGRLVGKSEKYKLSFKDTLKRIGNSLDYYRIEEASGINNWLNYQTESLSLEGLRVLKVLEQKQAIERREQVFNKPELLGKFPTFIATVSSTFVPISNGQEVLQ